MSDGPIQTILRGLRVHSVTAFDAVRENVAALPLDHPLSDLAIRSYGKLEYRYALSGKQTVTPEDLVVAVRDASATPVRPSMDDHNAVLDIMHKAVFGQEAAPGLKLLSPDLVLKVHRNTAYDVIGEHMGTMAANDSLSKLVSDARWKLQSNSARGGHHMVTPRDLFIAVGDAGSSLHSPEQRSGVFKELHQLVFNCGVAEGLEDTLAITARVIK